MNPCKKYSYYLKVIFLNKIIISVQNYINTLLTTLKTAQWYKMFFPESFLTNLCQETKHLKLYKKSCGLKYSETFLAEHISTWGKPIEFVNLLKNYYMQNNTSIQVSQDKSSALIILTIKNYMVLHGNLLQSNKITERSLRLVGHYVQTYKRGNTHR